MGPEGHVGLQRNSLQVPSKASLVASWRKAIVNSVNLKPYDLQP